MKKSTRDHDCCHDDVIKQLDPNTMPEQAVNDMASIFSALGDPTRIRIIHLLIQSEMCVCAIAKVLGLTQSAVSHQMRYLKHLRIVKRRKVGRSVYYQIDDDHIVTLFQTGFEHAIHP